MKNIKDVVYSMLITNTGKHFLDSGGENGRNWQENEKKTLKDFENEPEVEIDYPDEGIVSVSLFHYLTKSLEIDGLCDDFNKLPCDHWDSNKAYGLSIKQEKWLNNHNFTFGNTWNSYNGESNLSQTIQGCNMFLNQNKSSFEYPDYILLQIHNGCDVRGGYTDAKLFKIANGVEYFTSNPDVYGTVDGQNVSTSYNGNSLTLDDTNETPVITEKSKIELYLSQY